MPRRIASVRYTRRHDGSHSASTPGRAAIGKPRPGGRDAFAARGREKTVQFGRSTARCTPASCPGGRCRIDRRDVEGRSRRRAQGAADRSRRLHALPGAGRHAYANRVRRRQHHPALGLHGRGPGADEDKQGIPFVGRAGQLLTKIIEACTLRREDVYILNTIKCRPPENRNPEPDEVVNCRGFFSASWRCCNPSSSAAWAA